MFQKKKKENYEKLLGLNDDELTEFAKRFKHYLLAQKNITSTNIIKGLFILEDIKDKQIKKKVEEVQELNFKSFTNQFIRKYHKDIIDAYRFGYGAKRISKILLVDHNAKVSASTIERFLKVNKIFRDFKWLI